MKKCLASPKWTFKGLWFEVVQMMHFLWQNNEKQMMLSARQKSEREMMQFVKHKYLRNK